MNKKVIYIDTNDDITTIVNKIKNSEPKIIALVPPKKVGVLQSTVNLSLLLKSAKTNKKILIIITNNQALIRLAAINKIPIAKSLNSKPQLIEYTKNEVESEEDIIDGAELPISEFSGSYPQKSENQSLDNRDDDKLKSSKIKVPNYNKFRKKLFIGIFLTTLLMTFLVWAIIFAPNAKITIKTTTKTKRISETISLVSDSKQQNFKNKNILSQIQTLSKKKIVEFLPTGEKEVGKFASGELTLYRYYGGERTIPAGSRFAKGKCIYTTNESIVVPGKHIPDGATDPIIGQKKIKITATVIGEECNNQGGDYQSGVAGVSAKSGPVTGGSKKTVKVVTEEDLKKAEKIMSEKTNDSDIRELRNKFDSSVVIINDSLKTEKGEILKPKVDDIVDGEKAKIEEETKYTLYGIARKDIDNFVKNQILKNKKDLKIYEADDQKIEFVDYVVVNNIPSVRLLTNAITGPKIEEEKIKKFVAGKVTGEIKNKYESIDGIEKVKIVYKPFWVKTVPKDLNKINVDIDLLK